MAAKKEVDIVFSNTPTMYTDAVNVATRSDNIVLLRFYSYLPEKAFENFRTTMTKDDAKVLLEDLAQMLDHYPVKKTAKKSASSKKAALPVSK